MDPQPVINICNEAQVRWHNRFGYRISTRYRKAMGPELRLLTFVMYSGVIVGSEGDITELSTRKQLISAVVA